MPRRGLDHAQVVEAAAVVADAEGLGGVTLARVAGVLGVRPPSLYNHVGRRDEVIRDVAVRALGELTDAVRRAATGRAGADALAAVADAHRAYARTRPGRYAATVAAPRPGDTVHEAAAAELLDVITAALAGLRLEGDDAIHCVRAVRSAVHGFATLETGGGFALDVDPDASFARMIAALTTGLAVR